MKLLPFQEDGVQRAEQFIRTGGVFIADEMGLGKTAQAITLIQRRRAYPALIVCPASLKLNWETELNRWSPGLTVNIASGRTPRSTTTQPDVTIINYEILEDWLPVLTELEAVVLDESHAIKNGSTIRARAAIRLSDRLPTSTMRICLSGTPIVNHPTELIPQLRFLQRIEEFGGIHAFKQRYAAGDRLTELNGRLRSRCLIRRQKHEVMTELPARSWATILVPGDERTMREYLDAETDIINYIADRDLTAAVNAEKAEQLIRLHHLRRLATEAKLPAVVDWLESFPTADTKLVIFAHHRHIVEQFATRFANGCAVHGGHTITERQYNIDRFQHDPGQRIIVCSLRAAGIGITLTAASNVLFIEQGWTSAEMDQAIDRCHRIGQDQPVTAWNLLCADTIDERVNALIAAKRSVVNATTDGYITEHDSIIHDLIESYRTTQ